MNLAVAALAPYLPLAIVVLQVAVCGTLVLRILLRRNVEAPIRLTWIVVILVLPLIGVLAYVLVGEVRMSRGRLERHREIAERIRDRSRRRHARAQPIEGLSDNDARLARLAETAGRAGVRPGNRLEVVSMTEDFVARLVRDIDSAREHCHLQFYIVACDDVGNPVLEAVERAARRGVTCRLLYDDVGSRRIERTPIGRRLEAAGATLVATLPVNPLRALLARIDVRNHRKIVVIDGRTGWVGSQNLCASTYTRKGRRAPWVDTMVRIEGPAARDLQTLFVEDWFLDTDESIDDVLAIVPEPLEGGAAVQVVGTGPSTNGRQLRELVHAAIHFARDELLITTPYFVPDEATVVALITASRRGVALTLVLPQFNDSPLVAAASRAFYEPLLEAGARLLEYPDGLLHAKIMSVDRDFALVGSANMDRRSFEINFEVSMLVYDDDVAARMRFVQRSYMEASHPVDLHRWRRRRWPKRLLDNAAGTLAPLL